MTRAIILFAHGARDPEWARPFERLRDALAALAPQVPVEIAFLDVMKPDLASAVETLAAQGASSIDVVPAFMAQGGHLKRDLPLLLEEVRGLHPGLTLSLQPPLGEVPAVIDAMARHIAAGLR